MQNENPKTPKERLIAVLLSFMLMRPRHIELGGSFLLAKAQENAPGLTDAEIAECYHAAQAQFVGEDSELTRREENIKRIAAGLPELLPPPPSLVQLVAMLRAKKEQADTAHADRVQDMCESGSGDKDSQCDDADCGRFTDAASSFAAAAHILQVLVDEECHINDAGEEIL